MKSYHSLQIRHLYENIPRKNRKGPSPACLIEACEICINDNISMFNKKYYKQNYGCPQGGNWVPDFTDISMIHYDTKIIELGGDNLLFYFRYRDDIFLVWNGNENI